MKKSLLLMAALAAFTLGAQAADDNTVTFEDVTLGADTIMAMTDGANAFENNGFEFNYNYYPDWSYWSGFCVTGKHDTSFKDYHDQYNSCLGHGYDGSNNYAVVYPQGEKIAVKDGKTTISGFYVAANAYLQNAILVGDGMTTGAFSTGDWYRVDVIGYDDDTPTDTVSYYLADYRSETEANHYYVKDWTWLDLSKLGEVSAISFRLSSSRNNSYGMTTPGYFLMDNFNGSYDGTSKSLSAIDNTATAIATISRRETTKDAPVYNLAGQRVGRDYKGVVIRNGKKYVQK
ncbi:MAG: DUF4465 domain-containing protein [Prevotellaceae bacterium]|nr:DUF4465 domain-containing protein [Prevotellaceae bacterium]